MSSTTQHYLHNAETKEFIRDTITKHGWFIALFEQQGDQPAFAYSIGLWNNYRHPELICFGLPTETMHMLLNIGSDLVKNGHSLSTGKRYSEFLSDYPARFLSVDQRNIADYFAYAIWYHENKPFDAMQLVWPDTNHQFPWETGFDHHLKFQQPMLDRNMDFKFLADPNLGVYTTRQVIKEGKPILWVSHDKEDGDWQFLCQTTRDPEDVLLVSLREVVNHDPSVNKLFDLPIGWNATRALQDEPWELVENEVD